MNILKLTQLNLQKGEFSQKKNLYCDSHGISRNSTAEEQQGGAVTLSDFKLTTREWHWHEGRREISGTEPRSRPSCMRSNDRQQGAKPIQRAKSRSSEKTGELNDIGFGNDVLNVTPKHSQQNKNRHRDWTKSKTAPEEKSKSEEAIPGMGEMFPTTWNRVSAED